MVLLADKLVIGAFIVSILFIIIGHEFRDKIQEKLKHPLYKLKEVVFDWWSVTHFMLFAFFGFIKPNYPFSFFAAGILFEVFEDGMASDESTQLVNCPKEKNSLIGKIMCNGVQDSYWYGKLDDIFMNLTGYVFGQAIRTTWFPNLIQ